jgi:hypothetical protein
LKKVNIWRLNVKHNHLHISKDINGNKFLFLETHNYDSNGSKLGIPAKGIKEIRSFIANLPDNYPKPYTNKRSFIQDSLFQAGLIKLTAAAELGKLGKGKTSPEKKKTSAINGKKGGAPVKYIDNLDGTFTGPDGKLYKRIGKSRNYKLIL